MTEREWLEAAESSPLIMELLTSQVSERKLRLLVSALCRRLWDRLLLEGCRQAVAVNEQFADGPPGAAGLAAARGTISNAQRVAEKAVVIALERPMTASLVMEAAGNLCETRTMAVPPENFDAAFRAESQAQAAIIRDIFGNPFRPATIDQALLKWHDRTMPKLAQTVYDERELPGGHLDAKRLAVLADALEEAGCSNDEILGHLRGPGPHVRGCWVVDLLLGKR
jgi:hypothetical protein